jgi:hypothetical protein
MPRYRVHVCRIAYSHLNIEVEGKNSKKAMQKAEDEAGNHVFPTENASEYEAQGCTKIKEGV